MAGRSKITSKPTCAPPTPPPRPPSGTNQKVEWLYTILLMQEYWYQTISKKNLYAPPPLPPTSGLTDDRALPLVRTTEGNSTDQICEKYRRVHLASKRKASEIVSLTRRPIDNHTLTASIMITFTITFSLSFSSWYNSSAIARLVSLKLEKKNKKTETCSVSRIRISLSIAKRLQEKKKSLKNTIQLKLPNNF